MSENSESIQLFIDAIEAEGEFDAIEAIEKCRDAVTENDISPLVAYYKTRTDWMHKTGCVELLCRAVHLSRVANPDVLSNCWKEVFMDYLTVPENMLFPEGRIEMTRIMAICAIDNSDFSIYQSQPQLAHQRVTELLGR